ncbi:AAA family ATPase [Myxococcota bacterium]|nr:AAA family ATPase [Myxococcota bacterium]
MDPILDELTALFKARYCLFYLLSHEERRVEKGLAKLATALDRPLRAWTCTAGLRDASTADGAPGTEDFAAALRQVTEGPPALFLFKDAHPYLEDPDVVRRIRDMEPKLAEQGRALIFLSPVLALPKELEKDVSVLDVPLPTLGEVARLLGVLVKGQQIPLDVDLFEKFVKASLGLTEQEVKKVYTRILLGGHRFSEEDLGVLIQEKKRILRRSRFLDFHEHGERIEEVGGLEQLKEWLRARNQGFTEKARKYGLPQPKGLFILGVQGCGKSMTAKAVADLWKVPLLRLDVGGLLQASGPAEQNLRDAVRIAESMAPVVMWIDEIEKAFAGSEGDNRSITAARAMGDFLTWLQEKTRPVFVIATANDVSSLPPELLRKGRFDEIFFVDLPNVHERECILQIHLRRRGRDPRDFDCWAVAEATERFSGAEIEQAVIAAMFNAFSHEREVTTRDVMAVVRETVPLAITMDDRIKALKEWARHRTRPASWDTRRIDFFEEWGEEAPEDPAVAALVTGGARAPRAPATGPARTGRATRRS